MPPEAESPVPALTGPATWGAGDFSKIATGMVLVGELLCEAVELRAREKVLDVATGSGNTALAAARRRTQVTGVDFVPALLAKARERAAVEGFTIDFREADASVLPFPDGAFDVTLSTFGAIFAPDARTAARELVRVTRPGGRIGLATWPPDGYIGRFFALLAGTPSPDGAVWSPWSSRAGLEELFPPSVGALRVERRQVNVRADSPEAYLRGFKANFGPSVMAYRGRSPDEQRSLDDATLELVGSVNRARDGTVFFPNDYLEVIVTRPAGQ